MSDMIEQDPPALCRYCKFWDSTPRSDDLSAECMSKDHRKDYGLGRHDQLTTRHDASCDHFVAYTIQ